MTKHIRALLLSALLVFVIAGCSNQDTQDDAAPQASSSRASAPSSSSVASSIGSSSAADIGGGSEAIPSEPDDSSSPASTDAVTTPVPAGELTVHFGDDGAPFTMHLYDNSTAAAIAGYVGTADWRLPIYNYDGYDNWEVMQYYDLPSRYEIPSNAQTINSEKSGEIYYSEPNRIVLFYGDAEVTGEYTPIGYFDATADFVTAVSDNPVLEGWGNKIVLIKE